MAKAPAKNWAYTTLGNNQSLTLQLDNSAASAADASGVTPIVINFEVVQWTGSWAINEIPESMCMLAIGRDANHVDQNAAIHSALSSMSSMLPAKVMLTFGPQSEFSPNDRTEAGDRLWPTSENVIFDGYYVGFSLPKIRGKITFVVHLLHWLTDMNFTSSLSSISHPENHESLTFPSIIAPLPTGQSGIGDQGTFLGSLIGGPSVVDDLNKGGDIWGTLKDFMWGMTQIEGFQPLGETENAISAADNNAQCVDLLKKNDRAAKALARFESPVWAGPLQSLPYKYSLNLTMIGLNVDEAKYGIAKATSYLLAGEVVHLTLWDAMIGKFCPEFGIDICPMIDRAVAVASCPGYSGGIWRTITPDEYDYLDQTGTLPKPLRAVVAHGAVQSETGISVTDKATGDPSSIAGAYASDAVGDSDGAILYVRVPTWIGEICASPSNLGYTTGVLNNAATQTATTPTVTPPVPPAMSNGKPPTPANLIPQAATLLQQYARCVFIQNSLRGRVGTISGKLRFDIGPGSHLKILGSPEKFIGAEDELGSNIYGQVTRVTCEIDAEGRRASTSFVLSHVRTEAENGAERTSIDHHPFYGNNVMTGAPLLPAYEMK